MVLDKFNIEWSRSCKSKDYLFVGKIQKYTKTWLCGASIPSSFSSLKSKAQTMVVKFHSNNSIRKTGFKARFIGKKNETLERNFNSSLFQLRVRMKLDQSLTILNAILETILTYD